MRIEMFGDEIERLMTLHPLTGNWSQQGRRVSVFPACHVKPGRTWMARAIA